VAIAGWSAARRQAWATRSTKWVPWSACSALFSRAAPVRCADTASRCRRAAAPTASSTDLPASSGWPRGRSRPRRRPPSSSACWSSAPADGRCSTGCVGAAGSEQPCAAPAPLASAAR
jgi:hypothetical protein